MISPPRLRHYVDGERLAAAPGFDSLNPSHVITQANTLSPGPGQEIHS